jgi:hypothetical protein
MRKEKRNRKKITCRNCTTKKCPKMQTRIATKGKTAYGQYQSDVPFATFMFMPKKDFVKSSSALIAKGSTVNLKDFKTRRYSRRITVLTIIPALYLNKEDFSESRSQRITLSQKRNRIGAEN